MSVIRTVLGDVAPDALGAVSVHEHLIIDNPHIARDFTHIHLASVDDAVAEVDRAAGAGASGMVDAMPAASGRHPERLAEVSRRTGVSIIATTGLHTAKYYVHHPWATTADVDAMVALFVADIEEGIDRYDYTGPVIARTSHRAGIVKVAAAGDDLDPAEHRLFVAGCEVARRTGVAILTHCEGGRGGFAQIGAIADAGFPLGRVMLSHTDKVTDPIYHRDLLDTGVILGYDQALRRVDDSRNATTALVADAVAHGHADQIVFGTDAARRSLWTSLGGRPGIAWLFGAFRSGLIDAGIPQSDVTTMFEANPQRLLTLEEAP